MTTRRLGALLALAVLLTPSGCSNETRTAPSGPPTVTIQTGAYTDGLIEVTMRPAPPVDPPFGEALDRRISSPDGLTADLPSPHDALRRVSFEPHELVRSGSDYAQALPSNRVSIPPQTPGALLLSPDFDLGNPDLGDVAYAIWDFDLPGYGESSMKQTLGINAELELPAIQNVWVGLGNFDTNRWDWRPFEEDGVITLDSFSPYESQTGNILGILIALGQGPVQVNYLEVGVSELRATGEVFEPFSPPATFPDFPLIVDLTVDLSPDCSPINDQGGTWSCTAMATVDGALNYELGRLYKDCGWNFDVPLRRCGPRFVYNQTGVDLGGSCPVGGRSTNEVGLWLVDNGTSSEFNAPYGSNVATIYNCATNWTADTLLDASLLRPTARVFIGSLHPVTDNWFFSDNMINSVKAILQVTRKPVVFRTDLDANFGNVNYAGGGSWTYTGPRTGGHAMVIVGYDDARNGGSFKVRNSWGVNWGDQGYCWITYASTQHDAAGVYGYYFTMTWSKAVADRFCPVPPTHLPPFGFGSSDPQQGVILLEWENPEGATRFSIFRDSQETPIGFVSAPNNFFEDFTVQDTLTHVYWIKAHYDEAESGFSAPVFAWLLP